eukprot:PhM_4_TR18038/c0_g2_i10/m.37335/K17914/KIF13; kinesin family member 13
MQHLQVANSNNPNNIHVCVRVRPRNTQEVATSDPSAVHPTSSCGLSVNDEYGEKLFTYDCVFDEHSAQEDVYEKVGHPEVLHAIAGFNTCTFAYGQTGSGKTYTMIGDTTSNNGSCGDNNFDALKRSIHRGLVPRTLNALFDEKQKRRRNDTVVWELNISFYEVYNEKVRDLLRLGNNNGNNNFNLRVREHPVRGPYVEGLNKQNVSSLDETLELLKSGLETRTTAETRFNETSSRSHAVLSIELSQVALIDGVDLHSCMMLVDLAGSERWVSGSGALLKEHNNINKSLHALGRVIQTLSDGFYSCSSSINNSTPNCSMNVMTGGDSTMLEQQQQHSSHIPYRDSTLTWLLKDSLGGNSRTAMVASVSPAKSCIEETLSTLRYAERAKKIQTHAVVNKNARAALEEELKSEIRLLRARVTELETTAPGDIGTGLRAGLSLPSEDILNEIHQQWETRLQSVVRSQQHMRDELEWKSNHVVAVAPTPPEPGNSSGNTMCGILINLDPHPIAGDILVLELSNRHNNNNNKGVVMVTSNLKREDDEEEEGSGTTTIKLRLQNAVNVGTPHCAIDIATYTLTPLGKCITTVNGKMISKPHILCHGDRLVFGGSHIYMFVDTVASALHRGVRQKAAGGCPRVVDWAYATQEKDRHEQQLLRTASSASSSLQRTGSALKGSSPMASSASSSSTSLLDDSTLRTWRNKMHELQFSVMQLLETSEDFLKSSNNNIDGDGQQEEQPQPNEQQQQHHLRRPLLDDWIASCELRDLTPKSIAHYVQHLALVTRETSHTFLRACERLSSSTSIKETAHDRDFADLQLKVQSLQSENEALRAQLQHLGEVSEAYHLIRNEYMKFRKEYDDLLGQHEALADKYCEIEESAAAARSAAQQKEHAIGRQLLKLNCDLSDVEGEKMELQRELDLLKIEFNEKKKGIGVVTRSRGAIPYCTFRGTKRLCQSTTRRTDSS